MLGLLKNLLNRKPKDLINAGMYQSFAEPMTMFGYTSHAMMVPPFKPNTMLMLGYGLGNVSFLTKRVWGDNIQVLGIDNSKKIDYFNCPDEVIICNAEDFIKTCEKEYDYICVDLFEGYTIPKFVFNDDFISCVCKCTGKILSVNCTKETIRKLEPYTKYFVNDCVKQVNDDLVAFFVPRRQLTKLQ